MFCFILLTSINAQVSILRVDQIQGAYLLPSRGETRVVLIDGGEWAVRDTPAEIHKQISQCGFTQ